MTLTFSLGPSCFLEITVLMPKTSQKLQRLSFAASVCQNDWCLDDTCLPPSSQIQKKFCLMPFLSLHCLHYVRGREWCDDIPSTKPWHADTNSNYLYAYFVWFVLRFHASCAFSYVLCLAYTHEYTYTHAHNKTLHCTRMLQHPFYKLFTFSNRIQ